MERQRLKSNVLHLPIQNTNDVLVVLTSNNRVKAYGKRSHELFKLMGWTYLEPTDAKTKVESLGLKIRYIVKPFDNC